MYPLVRCTIVAAALFAGSATAHAEGPAASGFQISLSVPEICQIEASPAVVEQERDLVTVDVFEMCNSRRGFRVLASHRALEPGEVVAINYAGQVHALDASGTSEIAYRSGPVVGTVPVSIQSNGLVQEIAISLGMTAS